MSGVPPARFRRVLDSQQKGRAKFLGIAPSSFPRSAALQETQGGSKVSTTRVSGPGLMKDFTVGEDDSGEQV